MKMDITCIVPYANNARKHSEKQIQKIAESIKQFGFTNPLLINKDNILIAGHGRLEAAKLLGLTEVPVIQLSYLTEEQMRAYIITDNKLAELSEWDNDLLNAELKDLWQNDVDISITGFDNFNFIDMIEGKDKDELPKDEEVETRCKRGDIWQLDTHRLMCGDSTILSEIEALLAGEHVDILFTDPPYNINFKARKTKSNKFKVIKNDDLEEGDFKNFMQEVANNIVALDIPTYYIWCGWAMYPLVYSLLPFNNCIVWAKNLFGLGSGYRPQHEFCLFKGDIDKHVKTESNLWEVDKDTKYFHPTQKPVELALRALKNHRKADVVLDLFGGYGFTLIAAEDLKKRAYIMELDEKYCDKILTRWEKYTGKTAIKL